MKEKQVVFRCKPGYYFSKKFFEKRLKN